jgi:hypothetical protein
VRSVLVAVELMEWITRVRLDCTILD